jgi:hypothetical protein
MPSDRDQLPRHKPHPSKIESVTEEARLDTLLPSRPARGKLPSRLDQPQRIGSSSNTRGKRLPFKLTHSSRDQLPSRLDKSRRDQRPSSLNPSRQDRPSKQYFRSTKKNPLISRLDRSQPQQTEHISINPAFASAHDITMATRQTEYELLAPQEQKKQEEWAQKRMAELGRCPANFKWIQVPGGYNCDAGNHWMTDALVAEGKGGFLALNTYMGGSSLDPEVVENLKKTDRSDSATVWRSSVVHVIPLLNCIPRPCISHTFKFAREGKLPQGCEAGNGLQPLYLDGKCKSLS